MLNSRLIDICALAIFKMHPQCTFSDHNLSGGNRVSNRRSIVVLEA